MITGQETKIPHAIVWPKERERERKKDGWMVDARQAKIADSLFKYMCMP